MKTIVVLILLILAAVDIYIPGASLAKHLSARQEPVPCSIVYSEDEEGMIYEDTLQTQCQLVEIRSLPPMMEGDVPVKVKFIKGHYSLKRSLSIAVDDSFKVVIEDLLTGQIYDLKSATPYSFNVNRTIPDRFIMHINRETKTVTNK